MKSLFLFMAIIGSCYAAENVENLPVKGLFKCTTGNVTDFSVTAITNGSDTAERYMKNGTYANGPGGLKYPHNFLNKEGFTFATACKDRPLLEHPVHARVPYDYTGGTPGAYRLILAYNGQTKVATFCGMVAHAHQNENDFVKCPYQA